MSSVAKGRERSYSLRFSPSFFSNNEYLVSRKIFKFFVFEIFSVILKLYTNIAQFNKADHLQRFTECSRFSWLKIRFVCNKFWISLIYSDVVLLATIDCIKVMCITITKFKRPN